jgi:hypothetical protein
MRGWGERQKHLEWQIFGPMSHSRTSRTWNMKANHWNTTPATAIVPAEPEPMKLFPNTLYVHFVLLIGDKQPRNARQRGRPPIGLWCLYRPKLSVRGCTTRQRGAQRLVIQRYTCITMRLAEQTTRPSAPCRTCSLGQASVQLPLCNRRLQTTINNRLHLHNRHTTA